MFDQLHVLTLLLAPVAAYLAAALVFALFSARTEDSKLSLNATNLHYQDGQKS